MTPKELAEAKAKREAAAKAEKARVANLSDTQKAAEKAAKLAARPVLSVVISKDNAVVLTLKTPDRSQARAIALVSLANGYICLTTVEVRAREVKFKGA